MDNEQENKEQEQQDKVSVDEPKQDQDVQEPKEKTFTKDEVEQMISDRIKREREKAEADKAEAKRLAKMNADQKKDYEIDKQTKRAEEAEQKLARYEMQGQARKMFEESGVNVNDDDLSLVVTSEAETTQDNVNKLIAFAKRIREDVKNEMLTGKTPKTNGNIAKNITQSQFDLMSSKQKAELYQENPDLFKKLTGGI
ncbi:DUF4355 domain-containing protein [Ligilactobacillus aviarius]|uniref:DUF4355 domain-containing protein n=1 Tax=Ligilactobacillus aviarius TaxID=1606 RepID=UPI00249F2996|nr:DUF4355 domain-containing protein [Ligilactobacillus aviarius]